ncbi:hypothetical protein CLORY_42710 [Clostridium oryzae]|uniref:N-acetyltransferase domain-containing protein n=2 Tax=Clostridium oryzae TaxID=1450648 RepID=A0A1V4I9C5_9CLOT|nr:hypothetical protein CLORY_42710 [Clostridium oryzae]
MLNDGFRLKKLTLKNYNIFKKLYDDNFIFNKLNEDFIFNYNKSDIIDKFFLRKQLYLIKKQNSYIGYMWISKVGSKGLNYMINTLCIAKDHLNDDLRGALSSLSNKNLYFYDVLPNEFNLSCLEKLGFVENDCTCELNKHITNYEDIIVPDNIEFVTFKAGKHERIRCNLQNDIFMNVERQPLTISDIFLDEIQQYYVSDWCIFLKYDSKYIGYGQIIKSSGTPLIVNFGIIKQYRGLGFGELFLTYLLNLIYRSDYTQVNIRVSLKNTAAYSLYKKKGFEKAIIYNNMIYRGL